MKKTVNKSSTEREAFERALTIYYSGDCRIVDAFAQVEAGLIDRYYRRKKKYPDEMAAIDRKARAKAHFKVDGKRLHFEARQMTESHEIQRAAWQALQEPLPELAKIAMGEPREVEMVDENGERYTKTILVYPRDMINAAKLLHTIARDGVLPKGYKSILSTAELMPEKERVNTLDLLAPVKTNFKSITARTPDGEEFTVRVGRDNGATEADET